MTHAITPRRRRGASLGATALAVLALVAACGGAASPSASPSQAAAPSVAPSAAAPSVEPSVAPPSVASVAPSSPASSGGTAADPAEGITIGAPYSIAPLPAALQTTFETQMKTSLGTLGSNIGFGFRLVNGGKGQNFLMVLSFPSGALTAATFTGMVGGMGASMGATLTKTTSGGVDIYAGKSATGGIALFQAGDHAIIVISQSDADSLPIAQALVAANQ